MVQPSDPVIAPNDFGAGTEDATGYWEGVIEEAVEKAKSDVLELGPRVLNRPIGSKPITKDQRVAMFLRRDPAYWQERFERLVQMGDSPQLAAVKLIEFGVKMKKEADGTAA